MKNKINCEPFKKNLRNLMSINNVTQYDLAQSLNASQSAVSRWCLGLACPRGDMLTKIAMFFNTSPTTLMGDLPTVALLDEERLIRSFRSLSPKGKELALQNMDKLKHLYWCEKEAL